MTYPKSTATKNSASSYYTSLYSCCNSKILSTHQTCEKDKNKTKSRSLKHKTLAAFREALQLVYFNQKPSAKTQNTEKTTEVCAVEHATKCKIALSVLGSPSLDQILTCDTVFEHIRLHLILSKYLSTTDVET